MNEQRLALRQHLMNLRVPEEWAHLIAERADERGLRGALRSSSASSALEVAFVWVESEEGVGFWGTVNEAFCSEQEWFEENGHLTAEQVADIDKMVDAGIPQEWAILIAERRHDPACGWVNDSYFGPKFDRVTRPNEMLANAFSWESAPEEREFWASLHAAMGGWA